MSDGPRIVSIDLTHLVTQALARPPLARPSLPGDEPGSPPAVHTDA